MTGGAAGTEPPPADGDLASFSERKVLELEARVLGRADLGAGLGLELAGTRDEVVVDVRLKRMGDVDVELLGQV
jgi:hypothetical protein